MKSIHTHIPNLANMPNTSNPMDTVDKLLQLTKILRAQDTTIVILFFVIDDVYRC